MLTQYDIAILNMARLTLRRVEKAAHETLIEIDDEGWRGRHDAFDLGKFSETCDAAEGAIFNVLNVANSHLDLGLSNEQLHARPQEKDEPEEKDEEPEGRLVAVREDGSYRYEEDSDREYDLAKESGEL